MQLTINIPDEFVKDYNKDKFSDCFDRIIADIDWALKNGDPGMPGNYEKEVIEMLKDSFGNAREGLYIDKPRGFQAKSISDR